MSILHRLDSLNVIFFCPGCGRGHRVKIGGDTPPIWTWNHDMQKPTFIPSINIRGSCHCIVTEGDIQFLSDCTHALVGQTVPIPDWDKI